MDAEANQGQKAVLLISAAAQTPVAQCFPKLSMWQKRLDPRPLLEVGWVSHRLAGAMSTLVKDG
jgi:hypothetical protein